MAVIKHRGNRKATPNRGCFSGEERNKTVEENGSLRMSEADYQYECSRAELLGLPKPTREGFFANQKETRTDGNDVEEEISTEQVEEKETQREGLRRLGGGLDELNSILSNTQKKLNRFKTVCGSFSNLLKLQNAKKEENTDVNSASENEGGVVEEFVLVKKDDNSHLDKLDSLISKAEKAEVSLSSQNKQMRKYLN